MNHKQRAWASLAIAIAFLFTACGGRDSVSSRSAPPVTRRSLPNLIGIDPGSTQQRLNELVPGTMVMGTDGMGAMADHQGAMAMPRNSIPMLGGAGPFGNIDMVVFSSMLRRGFSAHDEPTMMEAMIARRMRTWSVPADLRDRENPVPLTPEVLAEARAPPASDGHAHQH